MRYSFEIIFLLPTTSKMFWGWFDGKYRGNSGWDRTPLGNGVYKISHPNSVMYESKITVIEEDRSIAVNVEHNSALGGRWHENLQEQAEDYFGEIESRKTKESKSSKIEEGLESNMPTMEEVVTAVGESLDTLDKSKYKIDTKEVGANFHFTLYKCDVYVGTYRIKPGKPGGSIQHTDVPELRKEWYFIIDLVWGDLQSKFGKFPWTKRKAEETQPDMEQALPLKANADKSGSGGKTRISKSKKGQSEYSDEEQLKALLTWDKIEPGKMNLDEFLDNRYGNSGGIPNVATSTFHGWRSKLRKKGLYGGDDS